VLALHRFPAQPLKGTIAALELMTKLKIDACRTAAASGTQMMMIASVITLEEIMQ